MCNRSFYKNILFTLMPFWFSFYDGFSGQTLHDPWLITVYNMVFTAVPPFVMGIFEKDMPEDAILKNPDAYVRIQVETPSPSDVYAELPVALANHAHLLVLPDLCSRSFVACVLRVCVLLCAAVLCSALLGGVVFSRVPVCCLESVF